MRVVVFLLFSVPALALPASAFFPAESPLLADRLARPEAVFILDGENGMAVDPVFYRPAPYSPSFPAPPSPAFPTGPALSIPAGLALSSPAAPAPALPFSAFPPSPGALALSLPGISPPFDFFVTGVTGNEVGDPSLQEVKPETEFENHTPYLGFAAGFRKGKVEGYGLFDQNDHLSFPTLHRRLRILGDDHAAGHSYFGENVPPRSMLGGGLRLKGPNGWGRIDFARGPLWRVSPASGFSYPFLGRSVRAEAARGFGSLAGMKGEAGLVLESRDLAPASARDFYGIHYQDHRAALRGKGLWESEAPGSREWRVDAEAGLSRSLLPGGGTEGGPGEAAPSEGDPAAARAIRYRARGSRDPGNRVRLPLSFALRTRTPRKEKVTAGEAPPILKEGPPIFEEAPPAIGAPFALMPSPEDPFPENRFPAEPLAEDQALSLALDEGGYASGYRGDWTLREGKRGFGALVQGYLRDPDPPGSRYDRPERVEFPLASDRTPGLSKGSAPGSPAAPGDPLSVLGADGFSGPRMVTREGGLPRGLSVLLRAERSLIGPGSGKSLGTASLALHGGREWAWPVYDPGAGREGGGDSVCAADFRCGEIRPSRYKLDNWGLRAALQGAGLRAGYRLEAGVRRFRTREPLPLDYEPSPYQASLQTFFRFPSDLEAGLRLDYLGPKKTFPREQSPGERERLRIPPHPEAAFSLRQGLPRERFGESAVRLTALHAFGRDRLEHPFGNPYRFRLLLSFEALL